MLWLSWLSASLIGFVEKMTSPLSGQYYIKWKVWYHFVGQRCHFNLCTQIAIHICSKMNNANEKHSGTSHISIKYLMHYYIKIPTLWIPILIAIIHRLSTANSTFPAMSKYSFSSTAKSTYQSLLYNQRHDKLCWELLVGFLNSCILQTKKNKQKKKQQKKTNKQTNKQTNKKKKKKKKKNKKKKKKKKKNATLQSEGYTAEFLYI